MTLVGKGLRDGESEAILDIIITDRAYDTAALFLWGGIIDMITARCSAGDLDLASAYAKIETKVETDLAETIKLMK